MDKYIIFKAPKKCFDCPFHTYQKIQIKNFCILLGLELKGSNRPQICKEKMKELIYQLGKTSNDKKTKH